jgi:InsA-like protein
MITQVLHCPYCRGTDIVRHDTTPEAKQRYLLRLALFERPACNRIPFQAHNH